LTIAKLNCTIFLLEELSAVIVKADHEMKTRVKLFSMFGAAIEYGG